MKINLPRYPKGNSKRKIKIQIDKWDTYGMDHTLALIILPMLVQLKDTKHGIPGNFVIVGGEDYERQSSFDFYKETHEAAWEEGAKRWDDALDKMIWSFQQIVDDNWEELYYHGKGEYEFEETKPMLNPLNGKMEKMYEMVDKNPGEHWVDFAGLEEHRKRMQEGIDLFAKHYFNLWD